MTGSRISILGLGRSGLAIARAAQKLGAIPTVVDQKSLADLPKKDAYEEAVNQGIQVHLEWTGSFDKDETDLIVTNPAVDRRHPALKAAIEQGIEVIGEIEFAYRISKAPIVAITGTNGKSTTTVMTYQCLLACGEHPVLCGNIFGSGFDEIPLTEAAANSTPDQTLVAEISSFQLEWVKEFRPAVAGIANIWPDHLDRYESFQEYAATKQKIFDRMDSHCFAVVKANDPMVIPPGGAGSGYRPRRTRAAATGEPEKTTPTVLTFGATGEHARVEETDLHLLNLRVKLSDLPFDEPHNYTNACMAALLTYALLKYKSGDPQGVAAGWFVPAQGAGSNAATLIHDAEQHERDKRRRASTVYDRPAVEPPVMAMPQAVVDGLKNFHGLAHRMERLGAKNGIRVINNSMCTNPDAVIKSATSVRDPAHLLIGGVNKALDFKPLKHYLANHRHKAYLFGSDAAHLNEMLGGTYPIFDTLNQAFEAATRNAVKGEVIMLAPGCASTDQFRDFRDRGNVFKAIAKEWLRT